VVFGFDQRFEVRDFVGVNRFTLSAPQIGIVSRKPSRKLIRKLIVPGLHHPCRLLSVSELCFFPRAIVILC
jgi:hypothetical protein